MDILPRAVRRLPDALTCAGLLAALAVTADAQVPQPPFAAASYPIPFLSSGATVHLAEVDGDGALDVLAFSGAGVRVRLNDHRGGLVPPAGGDLLALSWTSWGIDVADLDGDGLDDVVASHDNAHGFRAFLALGAGDFGPPLAVELGEDSAGIVAADLDGDDIPDLAIALPGSDRLALAFGLGDGTFSGRSKVPSGGGVPRRLRAADLDGDGDLDLLVSHDGTAELAVLHNDGAGAFTKQQSLATVEPIEALAVDDIDGDDVPDVAMLLAGGPSFERVRYHLGLGDGTFGAPLFPAAVAGEPSNLPDNDLALGDLDGDGRADIVYGTQYDEAWVLFGGEAGFTTPPARYDLGEDPVSLLPGDLDGDGWLDLLAATSVDSNVVVLLGDGGGAFVTPPPSLPDSGAVSAFALADVDDDGDPDLVSVRGAAFGRVVSVLLDDGQVLVGPPIETDVLGNGDNAPTDLVVLDLDGDGIRDVCLLDPTGDRVQCLPGLGDGGFGAQLDSPASFDPGRLAAGDVDGDGLVDLVLLHPPHDVASVQLGLGDGSFAAPSVFAVGDEPGQLLLADLDDDGDLDLVVGLDDGEAVRVFSGDGLGSFSQTQSLPAGGRVLALALNDQDGDGIDDLLVAAGGAVLVAPGLGDGSFAVGAAQAFPGSFDVGADLDLDGDLDLLDRRDVHTFALLAGDGQGGFEPAREFLVGANGGLGVADLDGDGVPDVVVAGTTKIILYGRTDPTWVDLGQGLAGSLGEPLFVGAGQTVGGQPITLALSFAKPGSSAWLVVGLSGLGTAFKGGTLVPSPDVLIGGLPVDGDGQALIATSWPVGVPAGTPVFVQQWVVDPAGPLGVSATNGVRATGQ